MLGDDERLTSADANQFCQHRYAIFGKQLQLFSTLIQLPLWAHLKPFFDARHDLYRQVARHWQQRDTRLDKKSLTRWLRWRVAENGVLLHDFLTEDERLLRHVCPELAGMIAEFAHHWAALEHAQTDQLAPWVLDLETQVSVIKNRSEQDSPTMSRLLAQQVFKEQWREGWRQCWISTAYAQWLMHLESLNQRALSLSQLNPLLTQEKLNYFVSFFTRTVHSQVLIHLRRGIIPKQRALLKQEITQREQVLWQRYPWRVRWKITFQTLLNMMLSYQKGNLSILLTQEGFEAAGIERLSHDKLAVVAQLGGILFLVMDMASFSYVGSSYYFIHSLNRVLWSSSSTVFRMGHWVDKGTQKMLVPMISQASHACCNTKMIERWQEIVRTDEPGIVQKKSGIQLLSALAINTGFALLFDGVEAIPATTLAFLTAMLVCWLFNKVVKKTIRRDNRQHPAIFFLRGGRCMV